MDDVTQTPAHAKPARRDSLLWVVAVIAAFALYDIWGAWTEVGDKSGFAHGTGWTLTVIVEVYGACALWAWLGGAPGRRSGRFAKWSAAVVLALSFTGQASSRLTARDTIPPAAVVVFVSVLPVIVLAMIAVLVHLRIKDRADSEEAAERDRAAAAEAQQRAAEASELDTLRAELEAQSEALSAAQDERDEAQRAAAAATAKAEVMERKLAAAAASKRTRRTAQKKAPAAPATKVPRDVDAQAAALAIIAAEPDITGKELGPRVGRSERWGQDFKKNLSGSAAGPADDNQETS